jgi:hypothetical protein
MLALFDLVVRFFDELAFKGVGGLLLPYQQKAKVLFLHFAFLQEETLSVFPEVGARKIIILSCRIAVFTPLSVHFYIVKRPVGDPRSDMYSELLELDALQLDVIQLECFLAKLEGVLRARHQVFEVTPSAVEHVPTLILALNSDEQHLVGPHQRRRDIAGIIAIVVAGSEDVGGSLNRDG